MRLEEFTYPTLIDTFLINEWTLVEGSIYKGKLFDKTVARFNKNPLVADSLDKFIEFKSANPAEPFGAKDYPMVKKGPMGRAVDGLRHAALTQDVSVFYTVKGGDLRLFGVFSHKEAGIGNTANMKLQKQVAKTMKKQQFSEY
jgi:mRNA-degrading endonuclease YafQ of YafQ-DinJ toxin-antitoxin module